ANGTRKLPWSSVVNDVTSPFWFSTTKVAFARGCELGASARTGPARVGLIVITPSIPVPETDCVWPDEKPLHMIRTARAIDNLPNGIAKFILTASHRSMTKPKSRKKAGSQLKEKVLPLFCVDLILSSLDVRHFSFSSHSLRIVAIQLITHDFVPTPT